MAQSLPLVLYLLALSFLLIRFQSNVLSTCGATCCSIGLMLSRCSQIVTLRKLPGLSSLPFKLWNSLIDPLVNTIFALIQWLNCPEGFFLYLFDSKCFSRLVSSHCWVYLPSLDITLLALLTLKLGPDP